MTAKMFDEKGTCKFCGKDTRAKATSLCNACYKLDLAIKNNPHAAQKILRQYVNPVNDSIIDQTEQLTWKQHTENSMRMLDIKWKGLWDYEDPRYNPYAGIRPKEEQ